MAKKYISDLLDLFDSTEREKILNFMPSLSQQNSIELKCFFDEYDNTDDFWFYLTRQDKNDGKMKLKEQLFSELTSQKNIPWFTEVETKGKIYLLISNSHWKNSSPEENSIILVLIGSSSLPTIEINIY